MRDRTYAFVTITAAILLDQATKQLALATFSPIAPISVLPFLDLTLAWNRGVSFGMFGGGGVPVIVFIAVSLAISGFLAWQMVKAETRISMFGYAFIVGGALGNVIDRAIYGAVIDFVLLYWRQWSWPVFNIADMAITLGVVLILIDSLWPRRASTTS
ncbi:MAG: signal peptidase II [Alphaproteobacteria bacterium]